MERSTDEVIIELSDFQVLLNECSFLSDTQIEYNDLINKLYEEAKKSDNDKQSYILWLLADLSEIAYSKDNKKVFSPKYTMSGQVRSMIPEDLTDKNIDFLKTIYDFIPNAMLKAKVGDILWDLKAKPKKIEYAEFAISTYINLPFEEHKSFYKNQLYMKRALHLASGMKKKDVIANFEKRIYKVFEDFQYDGYAYLYQLTNFMIENSLCNDNAKEISEKLDNFGEKCEAENSYNLASSYYARASLWANKFDENKALELQIKNAKSCIHHAEYVSKDDKHGISETAFYEQALKIIKNLPKEKRHKFISETEEKDIAGKIRKAGQKCISNMGKHFFPIDLSECVNLIINHISGKNKEESLEFLSLASSNITFEGLKESSIKMVQNSALYSFFPKQFYSGDGRIIARTKGYDFNTPLTEEDENVWQWMIFEYQNYIQVHVNGIVLPCLQVFTNEHNISFRELNEIVSKSTIFPNDRKGIITKGLMAGFEYDFITALHLLSPQIENMVRYQLRLANVKTSNIIDGIESENGLSTLVKNPEFEQIFGKDLGFEIKALMCDAFGPNLRNNVAHGLLDINQMQSHYVIYFWWFCLRMVYIDFWNSYRKD